MSDPVLRNWSDDELLNFVRNYGSQQPQMGAGGYAADAAAGIARGGVNTVSGMAGLPGDVQMFAKQAAGPIMGKMPNAPEQLPTSNAIRGGIEQFTGPIPEPKTALGAGLQTAVEMLPAAAFPARTAVQRVLNVAGPTVGGVAGEYMTNGSPTGKMAGALVGGALTGRGITPNAASPERMALVQALENEGIPLTAGQRTGNRALQWREEAAADQPFSSRRAMELKEDQGRAFTGSVLRRMGAPGDELATTGVIDREVRRIGDTFTTLSQRNRVNGDPQLMNDMNAARIRYTDNVLPSQRAEGSKNIDEIIDDIRGRFTNGTMAGTEYQHIRSRLSRQAQATRQNDPELSTAFRDVRNALDDAMGRSINPADRQAWQDARQQWENWKSIEKAVTGPGGAEGYISPSAFARAVAGQDRSRYARGQSDMSELAHAGEAILKPMPQSGTAPRMNASNLSIANLLAGAYNRAMISGPVQAYLGNQALPGAPTRMRSLLLGDAALAHPRQD